MEFKVLSTIEKANAVTSVPTVISALYLAGMHSQKLRLVITPDENTAEELCSLSQLLSEDPGQIILFPSWDSRPEYQSSPNSQIQAERLSVLFRMLNRPLGLTVISSIDALSQKLPPQEYVLNYSDVIKSIDEMSIDKITLDLTSCGYQKTDLVEQPGTFSVRGSIIDIYSPSENDPVRIELFGDFVETIKKFDPATQRTISDVDAFFISPVREISFSEQSILLFKEKVKAFLDQKDIRKDVRDQLIEFVENNVYFPGIEYYLPFFYNNTSNFADYVTQGSEIIFIDDYIFENKENAAENELEPDAVPYPLQDLFIPTSTMLNRLQDFKSKKIYSVEFQIDGAISIKGKVSEPSHIRMDIWDYHKKLCSEGYVVFYSCSTKIQAERVEMLIKKTDPTITLNETCGLGRLLRTSPMNSLTTICISPLNKGFILEEERIAVITETGGLW